MMAGGALAFYNSHVALVHRKEMKLWDAEWQLRVRGQQNVSPGAVLPPITHMASMGQILVPYEGPALGMGQWCKDKLDLAEGLTLKIVPGGK